MPTETYVRDRAARLSQSGLDPKLTQDDLDALVADGRRADSDGHPPDDKQIWRSGTAYVIGDVAVPDPRNGYLYRVTVAGTSGTAQPAFPLVLSQTVSDGGVTWSCTAVNDWLGAWDLYAIVSAAWEQKAGQAAGDYDVQTGGRQGLSRSQVIEQCLKMADRYRRRAHGSVSIANPVVDLNALYFDQRA